MMISMVLVLVVVLVVLVGLLCGLNCVGVVCELISVVVLFGKLLLVLMLELVCNWMIGNLVVV